MSVSALRALLLAACLVGLGGGLGGCDRDALPTGTFRQATTLQDLPEVVRRTAEKELPGVTLGDAWKNVDPKTRALHSYEVRGRAANGKVREVRVSPTGEVLETE